MCAAGIQAVRNKISVAGFQRNRCCSGKKYPDMHIVIPTVVTVERTVRAAVADWVLPVHVVTGEANRYDAFAACDAALAASGTVALELAMAKVPYTIAYKMNPLSSFWPESWFPAVLRIW